MGIDLRSILIDKYENAFLTNINPVIDSKTQGNPDSKNQDLRDLGKVIYECFEGSSVKETSEVAFHNEMSTELRDFIRSKSH